MTTFLTRVELHVATAADYEKLHDEMAKRRFSRQIRANDGTMYHLPTAEYSSYAELSTDAVRELADAAIAATGKTGWVITVRWDSASWRLPEV
jgi:hypothetical protein